MNHLIDEPFDPSNTIFIVGGSQRSGTSMMMQCLEAGGMDSVVREERDSQIQRNLGDKNYSVNEGGIRELSKDDYKAISANLDDYRGKLIKCMNNGPLHINPGVADLVIVFMRRDPEEIRQSWLGLYGKPHKFGDTAEEIEETILAFQDMLLNRRDVKQFQECWYRELVGNPLVELRELDWPFAQLPASQIVNPTLCRYKLEDLEVGMV